MPFFESGDAASKEELVKRVSKLLTPNETCLLAMEVKKKSSGHSRVLAIVCPRDSAAQTQCAVFIFKERRAGFKSKLMIRNIVPILGDFICEPAGGLDFSLSFVKQDGKGKSFKVKKALFTAGSIAEVGELLRLGANAGQIAVTSGASMHSSHAWVMNQYGDDEVGTMHVRWLLKQGASELPPPQQPPLWTAKEPGLSKLTRDKDMPVSEGPQDLAVSQAVAISLMSGENRTEWIQKQLMQTQQILRCDLAWLGQRDAEFTELTSPSESAPGMSAPLLSGGTFQ